MRPSDPARLTYENYDAKNQRPRMSLRNRAKIFLPYNALEGLYEEIEKKELHSVSRVRLAEDEAEKLDLALRSLRTGDLVCITWYHTDRSSGSPIGEYLTTAGTLTRITPSAGTLTVKDTVIPIQDILKISQEVPSDEDEDPP